MNNILTSNESSSIANKEKDSASSSRTQQKRGYQWLMNASDQEIFALHKKQVLAHANATRGASVRIDSIRHEDSGSQSRIPTGERLIRPKPVQNPQTINDNVPIIPYYDPNKDTTRFNYQRGGSSRPTYPNIVYGYPIYPRFKNYIPIGELSNVNNGNFTRSINYCNGAQNNFLSLSQTSFNIGSRAIMPSDQTNGNGHANLLTWNPFYNNRVNETFPFMYPTHNNSESSITSATPISPQQIGSNNFMSLVGSYNNGEQIAASFANVLDNPRESDQSPSLRNNYGTLLNQSFVQDQRVMETNDISEELSTNVVPTDGTKNKGSDTRKKELVKKFPANVKSLLATGVFDGVPIKYVSWSRENTLRGVIKGIAYLCSCKDCKFTKAVNAFEFENHAGCKTKHPNNHIYVQNGKSIYAVVQELKNTPEEKLFEVMEKVTGSPLDQKNFPKWKESYKTTKGEAQRINEQNGAIVISGTLD